MMPSNNNYAAWVYGSLQRDAARSCSTERLASNPNPLRWDVCLWPELSRPQMTQNDPIRTIIPPMVDAPSSQPYVV